MQLICELIEPFFRRNVYITHLFVFVMIGYCMKVTNYLILTKQYVKCMKPHFKLLIYLNIEKLHIEINFRE